MSTEELRSDRKPPRGAVRDKERTIQRWISAVGEVLKEKGYGGLTTKNIVKKAQMDRKLITVYFGNVDNLIDEYLNSKDYWISKIAPKLADILSAAVLFSEQEATKILYTLFDEVDASPELQAILSWEISESRSQLRTLADNREKLGVEMFKQTDKVFSGSDINFRAVMALQIAGIYYLNLHASRNGSTFCEIDINEPEGKKAVKNALETIIKLVYAAARRD